MAADPFDLDTYFPFFLGTIANRWAATSSRICLREFGIGVGEWRVLASIQSHGVASSHMVVRQIAMDAGAVSRSMARLAAEALVEPLPDRSTQRGKPYQLTAKGHDLHARLLRNALDREAMLLRGLSDAEKEQLFRLMRRLLANVDAF